MSKTVLFDLVQKITFGPRTHESREGRRKIVIPEKENRKLEGPKGSGDNTNCPSVSPSVP